MSIFESIISGFIQGVGEFLPISSSGHLILIPYLFGLKSHSLTFDVILHLGTFFSLLVYFFFDWVRLIKEGFLSLKYRTLDGPPERRLFWYIAIATIPAGIIGKLFVDKAETIFRQPLLVSLTLGGFAIVLYFAQKLNKPDKALNNITLRDALIIGLSQALAIVPGVSRSGATITSGLFLNLKKEDAVRFSFLLSMPIVLAAGLFGINKLVTRGLDVSGDILLYGFIVSGVSGLAAIHFILKFVKKFSFNVFIVYRIIVCLIVIGVFIIRK